MIFWYIIVQDSFECNFQTNRDKGLWRYRFTTARGLSQDLFNTNQKQTCIVKESKVFDNKLCFYQQMKKNDAIK